MTDNPSFDDKTLASIQRRIRFQSGSSEESSDDETLADIQRKQKQWMDEDEFTKKELAQLLNEPFWLKEKFERPDVTFKGNEGSVPSTLKDPIEFFKGMIIDTAIQNIVEQTNLYSVQKNREFYLYLCDRN